MTETQWEKKLRIHTSRSRNHEMDGENSPYEPTPYSVLERLSDSGYLTQNSKLLDYGCGMGRAAIFLSRRIGCVAAGLDYDPEMIEKAQENQRSAETDKVSFVRTKAEEYEVTVEDCFYFFNPFSENVLRVVLGKIIKSFYSNPRDMLLLFYYPTDETVAELMTTDELMFVDEIDCSDLFTGENQRERLLIFEIA